jgi:thymidine phosphorylase
MALGGEALALGGLAEDPDDGALRIEQALESGAAAEIFGQMVAAQGGPHDFVDRWPDRLPAAAVIREVPSLRPGLVQSVDGQALGLVVVGLGGGRQREGDRLNLSVGLSDLAGIGEDIGAGDPLCMVHAATEAAADEAIARIQAAYVMGETMPQDPDLIIKRIS